MTLASSRERVMAMAPMVAAVHAEGAAIHLQVGHGGLYAMEAWHEPYASRRRGPLLAASPVPRLLRPAFRGVPVHVMSTDEVHAMARRTGEVGGLGPRRRLRRRAARLGQRQAPRPVPVAVLQPARRRVRRLGRAPGARPPRDPPGGGGTGGRRLPLHRQGPGRGGASPRPTRHPGRGARHLPPRGRVGLRRGDAGRGVGAARHDAQPRRGAVGAVGQRRHPRPLPHRRARAGGAPR